MSRWKLFLLAGLLTLTTNSLSATSLTEFLFCGCDLSPCPTAPYLPFSGFFIGINGGMATNMAETFLSSNILTEEDISEGYLIEDTIYQLRPWGEAYGGWGWQFCWLYLGARIGVNFSKYDPRAHFEAEIINSELAPPIIMDFQNNTLKTELRIAEYTFDFKPGIVFCDNTMLFGLFGAALNKQHMHAEASYTQINVPGETNSSKLEASQTRSSAGFRGGAGIEHMICDCLSINLTYVFTRYFELNETAAASTMGVDRGANGTFMTKAYKQVISLGLAVYF